jgi:hypothetical protein
LLLLCGDGFRLSEDSLLANAIEIRKLLLQAYDRNVTSPKRSLEGESRFGQHRHRASKKKALLAGPLFREKPAELLLPTGFRQPNCVVLNQLKVLV